MTLENLVRIRQLNSEPPDRREFEGLVNAAIDRLNDHEKRNLAEYEGYFETDEQLLSELIASARELYEHVSVLKV